jgi:hypothetical protein
MRLRIGGIAGTEVLLVYGVFPVRVSLEAVDDAGDACCGSGTRRSCVAM